MVKKKITLHDLSVQIETLAIACAKNFKMIDERFNRIETRLDRLERQMDLAEIRWQKISNTVLNDHEPRIIVLENAG